MHMKIKTLALCLASLLPAFASANDQTSLHDRLTLEEGMSMISNGLYFEKTQSGESYVATNADGRRALAARVRAVDAQMKQAATGLRLDPARTNALLGILEAPQAKGSMNREGNCGAARVFANASSSNGTSANASAVNGLDFSPVTPTANYAEAYTDLIFNSSTGTGYTAAQAQAYEANSCYSGAYSSVTCPGASSPAVVAWAVSRRNLPRCSM
jgi:hypothetical protein